MEKKNLSLDKESKEEEIEGPLMEDALRCKDEKLLLIGMSF